MTTRAAMFMHSAAGLAQAAIAAAEAKMHDPWFAVVLTLLLGTCVQIGLAWWNSNTDTTGKKI